MLDAAKASVVDQTNIQEPDQRNPHQLISAVDLRVLLGGVTDMTIARWLKNGTLGFPKPIRIATRRYWYEVEVIEWLKTRPRADG